MSIILISDPRILAIPIQENHEPVVDLKDQTAIAFGPSPEIPNNTDYTKMRQTVYEKLLLAQSSLPSGLKLRLYEGYRSIALQEMLFNNRYAKVKQKNPYWSDEDLFLETIKLVSPVTLLDGSKNIPPHSTGAAVDVYLIDEKGTLLEMGIETKDWVDDVEGVLSSTNSTVISQEAQKNRQIMSKAMSGAGFVNYLTEYWHWSYGDRYWAYFAKNPYAFYGSL